ncbi:ketoacyl-ACP synthase III [Candidatus Haliotispira prima]|uniref:Beta-ketoacyl-[acyl-carrier-protein] synthase III n=1 Tax=Candidatus Haliotispira prima TaxID=3034016 RepID=A0ABY8MHV0_9SPIO|nr:ketoacyl-ACP synthase III [Candidatus Haliotispira prima]
MNSLAGSRNDARHVAIKSFAYHVPERVVSNQELAGSLDTSDEWIVSHTGIRQRHIAARDQASSDLACRAARQVLQNSDVAAEEIDLIVLATATPDYNGFPSTACVLQDMLGCRNAVAFDITAACSGFIYGLEIARSMMIAGPDYNKALVVGAEVFSKIINWQDRSTCVLFGDGAGVALLSRDSSATLVLDSLLKSDGKGAEKLWVPEGGSRAPFCPGRSQAMAPRKYVEMDGRAVYNFAVAANQEILNEILERNGLTVADLRYIVPHQANLRIIQAIAKREKIPMEMFFTNIDRYANTSAASIPIALAELAASGDLRAGDLILCLGFGAGLTYAGVLLQWGKSSQ